MKRRRAFPAHDWPRGLDAGPPQTCETCGAEWDASYESPPPFPCKRTPLESTGTLDRSKGLSPVSERKQERRHEDGVKHTYGPAWKTISRFPCCVCGTRDGAPADHWVPVGRGGTDVGNCLPLCSDHQGRHRMGEQTWAERHDVDPKEACEWAWRTFARRRPRLAQRLEQVDNGATG